MSTTISGVPIIDMPDLGAFTSDSSIVGEHAGSGRFGAAALAQYYGQYFAPLASVRLSFATIAALRAYSGAAAAGVSFVQGYYEPSDGGDGEFVYAPADTTSADNGGTVIVDAAGRRWYRAAGGTSLSAKWFGARGDNATDDTAPINAVFEAVITSTTGGAVYFAPGIYLATANSSTFTGLNQVRIFGAGPYASQIKFTGTGVGWTFVNCQNVFLQSLAFYQGAGASSLSGVAFNNASGGCTVDACQFIGFDTNGLRFVGTVGTQLSGNKVTNCMFLQNAQEQLHMLYSNDFWIENNQFGVISGAPHPAYGCYLDHCSAGTYSGNYHWSNNVGFAANVCAHNRIEINRFEMSDKAGAILTGGVNNIFAGNTVHTNSQAGANQAPNCAFTGETHTIVANNQSFDWTGSPLANSAFGFGAGCDYMTIRANQGSDYLGSPFYFDPSLNNATINGDQSLSLTSGGNVAAGTVVWLGQGGQSGGETNYTMAGRTACIAKMYAAVDAAPGVGQSFVYTVFVDGAATPLTATLSGSVFSVQSVNTVVILRYASSITLQLTTSAGAAVASHRVLLVLVDC